MNTIITRNHDLPATKYLPRIISVAALVSTIFIGVSDAGIGRNGIASGRITAFASIFVNNRELFIDNATVTIDGQPGSGADLKLGQVVFVRGVFDSEFPTGDATEVEFMDIVEGPVSSIDSDEGRLLVLGQSIRTDPDTIIALLSGPGSLDDLDVDDRIEVSGFVNADGEVLASRIEQLIAGSQHEVTGTVDNLAGNFFTLNALTVNFSGGTTLINFPSGSIAEGDVVEAKGSAFGENGELLALSLEFQEGLTTSEHEVGEFEGLITDFTSAGAFSVAGTRVSTNELTIFTGGGPANLTANTSVEVLGQFDNDGILLADQVTIRGTRIRIEGPVDSASATELRVFAIPVGVVSNTRLKDKSALHLKPFELNDFYTGDFAEIRSFKNPGNGTPIIAEHIVRAKEESDVRLQGFVGSSGAQYVQILGVTIDVDEDTRFTNADDEEISSDDFFDVLSAGTFVVVHGEKITDTGISAARVELALDD